ncbi:jg16918 [Pararge aegeria aegeria]|uniref:Jg16918 protein n=1 Tax=Pararge aegeria aegeria TaxID=348720 RepID=A0A8S4SM05_9NEOP|nr:jg16918 [Pararge aegeria aegeria]
MSECCPDMGYVASESSAESTRRHTSSEICRQSFSEEMIEAKCLLFESVPQRKVKRKGEDTNSRNIEDIIRLLKGTEPDDIPIFVAPDLQKLPPVSFDHVDRAKTREHVEATVLNCKCPTTGPVPTSRGVTTGGLTEISMRNDKGGEWIPLYIYNVSKETTEKDVADYVLGMPAPYREMNDAFNRELEREREYDHQELDLVVQTYVPLLNYQQKEVYDTSMKAIDDENGGINFLDAPGGTGKTFLM